MDKQRNVFISHHSKDDHQIAVFKRLLSMNGYTVKNSSIDSSKPNRATNKEYIQRLLRLRINWAGTFICLIGSETHEREWVDWEIQQAHNKNKRIIGVFLRGGKDADVPESLNKYGHSLVGWNAKSVIGAIEGQNSWCKTDGSPRESYWSIDRGNC